jgi:hypothetical protein
MDIWWCPMDNGVPGQKSNLGPKINGSALDCCPLVSCGGDTIYFCSDRAGGFGGMDLWMSINSGGQWSDPVNCGATLNSSATDCPRWLSNDGKTMIQCSTRAGGFGLADHYYSEYDGSEWGTLINLGENVNTSAHEWGPGFYDNKGTIGGIIYFGSGRSGGFGNWDLWRCIDSGYTEVAKSNSLGQTKAHFK